MVLPDADEEQAKRMVTEAGARLLVYGHIHTQYQRRVSDAALLSVGAVSGSNDVDPQPAYTMVSLDAAITVEARRVDGPLDERLAAYSIAGIEPRFSQLKVGHFQCEANREYPFRSGPDVRIWCHRGRSLLRFLPSVLWMLTLAAAMSRRLPGQVTLVDLSPSLLITPSNSSAVAREGR